MTNGIYLFISYFFFLVYLGSRACYASDFDLFVEHFLAPVLSLTHVDRTLLSHPIHVLSLLALLD
jgi:hypothetical protein